MCPNSASGAAMGRAGPETADVAGKWATGGATTIGDALTTKGRAVRDALLLSGAPAAERRGVEGVAGPGNTPAMGEKGRLRCSEAWRRCCRKGDGRRRGCDVRRRAGYGGESRHGRGKARRRAGRGEDGRRGAQQGRHSRREEGEGRARR
jgi:hypothetical protein